jgi:hypothetical protein
MNEAASLLLAFLRQAWMTLAAAFLAFALLAGIAQMLRMSSAGVLGANRWMGESISAMFAVLLLGLFAFLGVPQVVQALQATLPGAGGCGPISELGSFASGLIGGLAALRMLKAALVSALSASMGGTSTFASALIESAEALFGMLLAGAAIPLAAWFLGAC